MESDKKSILHIYATTDEEIYGRNNGCHLKDASEEEIMSEKSILYKKFLCISQNIATRFSGEGGEDVKLLLKEPYFSTGLGIPQERTGTYHGVTNLQLGVVLNGWGGDELRTVTSYRGSPAERSDSTKEKAPGKRAGQKTLTTETYKSKSRKKRPRVDVR